jgi:hypothetical protein
MYFNILKIIDFTGNISSSSTLALKVKNQLIAVGITGHSNRPRNWQPLTSLCSIYSVCSFSLRLQRIVMYRVSGQNKFIFMCTRMLQNWKLGYVSRGKLLKPGFYRINWKAWSSYTYLAHLKNITSNLKDTHWRKALFYRSYCDVYVRCKTKAR